MTARIANKNKKLIVEIDLEESPFQPSSSGKSLPVASTRSNIPTDVKIDGQNLVVNVNAYIKK